MSDFYYFILKGKVKCVVPGQKIVFFNDASRNNGNVTKRLNLEHATRYEFEYVVVHFSHSSSTEKVINN